MRLPPAAAILVGLLALPLHAASPAPPPSEATKLDLGSAAVLGIVEGVTEFLPISSTGHLIIANELLGLESDAPLRGPDGAPLWHRAPSPSRPEGVPLTLKLAADTYTVIIQVGAILAVLLLYWRRVVSALRGLAGADPEGGRLLRALLLAFVPVAAVGLLVHDYVDRLFSVRAVILAQVAGAALMIAAERWRRRRRPGAPPKDAPDLSATQALGIGGLQCLALWPGTSRSMVTIIGGYFAGLSPARAAEFSFLVGLPVLGGAAFVKSLSSGPAMISVFGWKPVLFGIAVAALSAAVAVRFLVGFLSRHGLAAFALYRIALAAALGLWFSA